MENFAIKTDGFRLLDNLHTTARQIPVFSAIIKVLGNKQLPKSILERLLFEWSISEENNNPVYRQSKGKITKQGKKTGALRYHIELSPSLGLTHRFNVIYQNTKISKIFLYFFQTIEDSKFLAEKVFYLYQLLNLDADGILLVLSELTKQEKQSQAILQKSFKEALNTRLQAKKNNTSGKVNSLIVDKQRTINFVWKNAGKYAEHLIAPRYEWLFYLGLVNIFREKNTTLYSLTAKGVSFYRFFPNLINNEELKEINNEWLNDNFFSLLDIVYPNSLRKDFESETIEIQNEQLGNALEKARKVVQSSIAFKLALQETLLFVGMYLFVDRNTFVNFSSVIKKLSQGFSFNKRRYLMRIIGRSNQGYITITSIE